MSRVHDRNVVRDWIHPSLLWLLAFLLLIAVLILLMPRSAAGWLDELFENVGGVPFPQSWKDEALLIDGSITPLTYDELRVAWGQDPSRYKRVILSSPGGDLFGALSIATFVRKEGLDTYVGKHESCISACTLIYQAGIHRVAHPTAVFMYHYVSVQAPNSQRTYINSAFTKLYKDALRNLGASNALLSQIGPSTFFYLKAEDALPYGVVTELDERILAGPTS
jgi:ATP-dependent protease ClpP protease subunit